MSRNSQPDTTSVYARLMVEGKVLDVSEISYGVNRNSDASGRPSDAPKCMLVKMLVSSFNQDANALIYSWVFQGMALSGRVEFGYWNNPTPLKEIEFFDAVCIGMKEILRSDTASVFREVEYLHVPNNTDYRPRYRGQDIFYRRDYWGFNLVVKPVSLLVDHIEIRS